MAHPLFKYTLYLCESRCHFPILNILRRAPYCNKCHMSVCIYYVPQLYIDAVSHAARTWWSIMPYCLNYRLFTKGWVVYIVISCCILDYFNFKRRSQEINQWTAERINHLIVYAEYSHAIFEEQPWLGARNSLIVDLIETINLL